MTTIISNLLPTTEIPIVVFMMSIFFISGIVKGFLGLGLPAAAMAFLTLIMDPVKAIPLLFLPLLFTNLAQFSRSPNPLDKAREFWLFAIALMVTIFITSLFISSYPKDLLTIFIGLVMIIFSTQALLNYKIPVSENRAWHFVFGSASGVLGGLSSIWSPPIAMYLMARNYKKEDFIGVSGFLFLCGCFPLGLGLYFAGVLNLESAIQSLIGLFFVLVGFRVGEIARGRVPQDRFRKILLISFFIMGLRLVLISVF